MKDKKINNHMEYLSAIFILSYFLIHSIIPVLIGISISLYFINLNKISHYARYIKKILISINLNRQIKRNNKSIATKSISKRLETKDKRLNLVEQIEELGYIPCIDEDTDINAA